MPVALGEVEYTARGKRFGGFLADGSGGKKAPGVLVIHEGRGYTKHPQDRARMLAELGYVAFAPEFFGPAASLEHAFELMQPYAGDRRVLNAQSLAALAVLQAHPHVDAGRLAAIGFCWGGFVAMELACFAELRAVVGFHPGLSLGSLSDAGKVTAKFLVCVGDQDCHVPMADIQRFIAEMNAAKVDTQILLLLGAPHSFTNPEPYVYPKPVEGVAYDPVADKRAWKAMLGLFEETLG